MASSSKADRDSFIIVRLQVFVALTLKVLFEGCAIQEQ